MRDLWDWLMEPEIGVGRWIADAADFLEDNASWLFTAVEWSLDGPIAQLEDLLLYLPALAMAVLAGLVGWWLRGRTFGLFTFASFFLVDAMGMWEPAMESLSLVLIATIAALLAAVPLGILAARSTAVSAALRPVLDFMQTLPVFVYLIPAITFFGIGVVPGVVATLIFAMPPGVRLTELGIRQVDPEVVEAAQAFGATANGILVRVQIPLALPTIMAGVNQVVMLALSMVVIAGMVGAGGLGAEVVRGIQRLNIGLGFEGGISVVIIAIFLDRITEALGRKVDPSRSAA